MSDKKILSNIKKPEISYCRECVYPSNSAVTLSFDKNFVCSGCNVSKEKNKIDYSKEKTTTRSFKNYEKKETSYMTV